jgi:hypothetical protein
MCLTAAAMAGLTGFKIHEQLRAGKQTEKAYQDIADEERTQAMFEGVRTTEQLHQGLKESEREQGQITASAAGKGLRVGGSVNTMLDQARARYRSRRRMLNLETSESMRRREIRARQFAKAGMQARKTSYIEALETGGSAIYSLGKKFPKRNPIFGV